MKGHLCRKATIGGLNKGQSKRLQNQCLHGRRGHRTMTESYLQHCNIVMCRNHFGGDQSCNALKRNKYMLNATVRRCRKEGKRIRHFLR